jgi:hypothetical protein
MMNWKGRGRRRSWPYFKLPSRHALEGLRETTCQLSEASGRDLKQGPSKYVAGRKMKNAHILAGKHEGK